MEFQKRQSHFASPVILVGLGQIVNVKTWILSDIRPHKCPTCNKTFPMRYMVREHMRTHSGDKPYLCNLCGTSFGNRGHLYRHIRSHELGTLHKRGRPRKNGPILLKIAAKGKSGEQGYIMEDSSVRVMEIKTDPGQSEQDTSSSVISGPTYITVHTADGEVPTPVTTVSCQPVGEIPCSLGFHQDVLI